jgi:hypothetical protein
MRRSTVLSLPLQLVFPGKQIKVLHLDSLIPHTKTSGLVLRTYGGLTAATKKTGRRQLKAFDEVSGEIELFWSFSEKIIISFSS